MTATDKDRVYDQIREAGGRITVTTRTVVSILLEAESHLTADDIIDDAERRSPGIAPSTVYRILQRLDELGIVEHVHSGHGPAFYHVRERGHAHLVCSQCGNIIDIPDRVLDSLGQLIRRRYHFTVESRHTALSGRCESCAARG
jgi:Fur family ferric uptake transcriptional regulator